jgi:hypothetical protein
MYGPLQVEAVEVSEAEFTDAANPGFCALNADKAVDTVAPSAWQAAIALFPVIPPRAKMTTAARIPSTTITMRSSIKVKPSSAPSSALCNLILR